MHKFDKPGELTHALLQRDGADANGARSSWRVPQAAHETETLDDQGLPEWALGPRLQVLIELRNRSHLSAAYGVAVADEVLAQLQLRALCLGGEVCTLDAATLLVNIPEELHEAETDASAPLIGDWMEHWQLWLSTAVTTERDGRRVLPVVSLSRAFRVEDVRDSDVPPLGCGDVTACAVSPVSPWALEMSPLDDVQFLCPVGRGIQWRETYMQDMQAAIDLHDRLASGQLSLDVQPVVHACDHSEVLYMEALLRGGGDVEVNASTSIGSVVPALERLGLVRELDRVVVLSVLNWLESEPLARVGCNVSALSLVSDSWWSSIIARLQQRPDVAARLTLEITETAAHYDHAMAAAFARRLQSLGCQIALDDFGVGGSSFAFMHSVRPQVAKLDGSLVQGARESSHGERLFASLAAYCQTVAVHVVAEGVERPQDLVSAQRAGVDCLQGHAIAEPAPMSPRLCLATDKALTGWGQR